MEARATHDNAIPEPRAPLVFWLLLGYLWLFIHRPFEIYRWLGDLRLELVYMLLTGIVWASGPKVWRKNPLHIALFCFLGAILTAWVASPYMELGYPTIEDYLKYWVFYVILVTTPCSERDLKRLMIAMVIFTAGYQLHSFREYLAGRREYRMGTPRMIGVDISMANPNTFAFAIVYTLAFVPAIWNAVPSRWWKLGLAGYVLFSVMCVALTGSRGAFLGLFLCLIIVIAATRWRWQLFLVMILAAPVGWVLMPPKLQNRFETIIDPSVGPKNAQESAEGRTKGIMMGLDLWGKYPVTGVGPGAWRAATGSDIESHNLYGQVIGQTGTLGTVALGSVILIFFSNVRKIRRTYREHPEWERDFLYELARSLAVALLMMLFAGNFGHNLFRHYWLWYSAFLIIAARCVEERVAGAHAYRVRWQSGALASMGGTRWPSARRA